MSLIYVLKRLNLKTIYFNFKCFPFSDACRLPVFVSQKVYIKDIRGTIHLPPKIYSGIIKIGFEDVGIFDKINSRTVWEVMGNIHFIGKTDIGHGSKICVGTNGTLVLGKNFKITAESSIVCFHKISFGDDCLLSWEILMMDTDFHKIYSEEKLLNANREIIIGKHVWIGARCTLLKGSHVADDCVVAANSLVAAKLLDRSCLYGGQPAKLLKEKVRWEV